jgi:translation initiation factor IF-3
MKFHANVEDHDYQTKMRHIREFLEKGNRVKASLFFRGRENEHRDLGYNVMNRLIKDCEDLGAPESAPKLFGNNLVMLLRPNRGTKPPAPQRPPSVGVAVPPPPNRV